jgi:ATP-dependent protease ClpP protease subunit
MFKLLSVVLSIAIASCMSWPVQAASTYTANPNRSIYITGPVGGSILDKAQQLLDMTDPLKQVGDGSSKKSPAELASEPVYIIINSPGGAVLAGTQFVNAMRIAKERGVTLKCLVPVLAASMAFIIFNECSERYALDQSIFLWHAVRTVLFGVYTANDLQIIMSDLLRFQSNFNELMINELDISEELYYLHYNQNSLLTALYLTAISPNYMVVVSNISGVENVYKLNDSDSTDSSSSVNTRGLIWFGEMPEDRGSYVTRQ